MAAKKRLSKKRPGRDFELAVHRFVQALDPAAEVLFDHAVTDVHTHTPRQVDVWVRARFLGHFPMAILVSCKDYARPLDIGHIGAFHSEVTATGASTGIIYSRNGFSKPAIAKAKSLGLTCCRLYQHQAADLPEILFLRSYLCFPHPLLEVSHTAAGRPVPTWAELVEHPVPAAQGTIALIDHLEQMFFAAEEQSISNKDPARAFPTEFETRLEIPGDNGISRVTVRASWRMFVGRVEAYRVDGSYCINDGAFLGAQTTPLVDRFEPPGPGWEEIFTNPTVAHATSALILLSKRPFATRVREKLAGDSGRH